MDRRWVVSAAAAVLIRPWLWATALRQLWRLRRQHWWRQPPFVPFPDPSYLHFRLVVAYGDHERAPDPADVVVYLRWCRAWPHIAR